MATTSIFAPDGFLPGDTKITVNVGGAASPDAAVAESLRGVDVVLFFIATEYSEAMDGQLSWDLHTHLLRLVPQLRAAAGLKFALVHVPIGDAGQIEADAAKYCDAKLARGAAPAVFKSICDRFLGLDGAPVLAVVDAHTNAVLNDDARQLCKDDTGNGRALVKFPYKKVNFAEITANLPLLDCRNDLAPTTYVELLQARKPSVVIFFFSSMGCVHCAGARMALKELYYLAGDETKFEIILCSHDINETGFAENVRAFPAFAIPYDSDLIKQLTSLMEVKGTPAIAIVDAATGRINTTDGRTALQTGPPPEILKSFPWDGSKDSNGRDTALSNCIAAQKLLAAPVQIVLLVFPKKWFEGMDDEAAAAAVDQQRLLWYYMTSKWADRCTEPAQMRVKFMHFNEKSPDKVEPLKYISAQDVFERIRFNAARHPTECADKPYVIMFDMRQRKYALMPRKADSADGGIEDFAYVSSWIATF